MSPHHTMATSSDMNFIKSHLITLEHRMNQIDLRVQELQSALPEIINKCLAEFFKSTESAPSQNVEFRAKASATPKPTQSRPDTPPPAVYRFTRNKSIKIKRSGHVVGHHPETLCPVVKPKEVNGFKLPCETPFHLEELEELLECDFDFAASLRQYFSSLRYDTEENFIKRCLSVIIGFNFDQVFLNEISSLRVIDEIHRSQKILSSLPLAYVRKIVIKVAKQLMNVKRQRPTTTEAMKTTAIKYKNLPSQVTQPVVKKRFLSPEREKDAVPTPQSPQTPPLQVKKPKTEPEEEVEQTIEVIEMPEGEGVEFLMELMRDIEEEGPKEEQEDQKESVTPCKQDAPEEKPQSDGEDDDVVYNPISNSPILIEDDDEITDKVDQMEANDTILPDT